ncbi:MAG: hypothetical protein WCP97_02335 [bacterium]
MLTIKQTTHESGNIALVTLLIVMVVTLAIGLNMLLISLNSVKVSFGDRQSLRALALAESCLDEVYLQLKNNPSYMTTTVTLPIGVCTVDMTTNESQRIITVQAAQNDYYRKIQTTVSVDYGRVIRTGWQEI